MLHAFWTNIRQQKFNLNKIAFCILSISFLDRCGTVITAKTTMQVLSSKVLRYNHCCPGHQRNLFHGKSCLYQGKTKSCYLVIISDAFVVTLIAHIARRRQHRQDLSFIPTNNKALAQCWVIHLTQQNKKRNTIVYVEIIFI